MNARRRAKRRFRVAAAVEARRCWHEAWGEALWASLTGEIDLDDPGSITDSLVAIRSRQHRAIRVARSGAGGPR